MKFSTKDFFSKGDQIRSFLRIWSHLLKKSKVENFIFCPVLVYKVYYTRYQVLQYLWQIKYVLKNGHSKWPKYYDQYCLTKFDLHFTSLIMIRISENGLTLDQNSIKKTNQNWKLSKFDFWPKLNMRNSHCVKSVQIRSFFWSEYRKIRIRKNFIFGHFLRNEWWQTIAESKTCHIFFALYLQ